jgi:hypothetical protein
MGRMNRIGHILTEIEDNLSEVTKDVANDPEGYSFSTVINDEAIDNLYALVDELRTLLAGSIEE